MRDLNESDVTRRQEQMVNLLSRHFTAVYHINLQEDSYIVLMRAPRRDVEYPVSETSYSTAFARYCAQGVHPEDSARVLAASRAENVRERLALEPSYTERYRDISTGAVRWTEMCVSRLPETSDEVMVTFVDCTEMIRREKRAQRHQKLRADALAFVSDHEEVDVEKFLDFFAERLLEISGCDQVAFRHVDGLRTLRNAPGVKVTPLEVCAVCPFCGISCPHTIFEEGVLELPDVRKGYRGYYPPAGCLAKSVLVGVVKIDGIQAGLLTLHYFTRHHKVSAEGFETFEMITDMLGILLSRIRVKREVAELRRAEAERQRLALDDERRRHQDTVLSAQTNFEALEKALLVLESPASVDDSRPFLDLVREHFGAHACYMSHYDFDRNRVVVLPQWVTAKKGLTEALSRPLMQTEFRDDLPTMSERTIGYYAQEEILATARAYGFEDRIRRVGIKSQIVAPIFYMGKPWGDLSMLFCENRRLTAIEESSFRRLAEVLEIAHARRVQHKTLQKALVAAQAAERTKTNFLATMSHEIRTPLNAVVGFAEFLQDDNLSEEARRNYLQGITKSSQALLALINDILDLSKIDAGRMSVRGGACDMRKLCREMRAVFAFAAQKKGVRLRYGVRSDFPVLALQEERMRQIFLNLVGNAVKFTNHGRVALVASWTPGNPENRQAPGTLTIKVMDTGVGIPVLRLRQIFDPFSEDGCVRGGKVYQGTGLGLPICKRLVESVGGKIEVSSEVGRGSLFTVTIPEVEIVAEGASPEMSGGADPAIVEETPLRTLHVVLVDDVPVNLLVIRRYIEKAGVPKENITSFGGADEALAALKRRPSAELVNTVVFTDMWMPKMTGEDLARELRQVETTLAKADGEPVHLPVIAVTADVGCADTFNLSLFDGVLTKPVTGDKIREALHRLV